MRCVVAIDPGLASCGLVSVMTDGTQHVLSDVSVCVTSKSPHVLDGVRDNRVVRAREVRHWLRNALMGQRPVAVVLEDFGFIQQAHATACLAMAYMAIVDVVDSWGVPIVTASANVWRNELAPLHGVQMRRSTKGLSKSEAKRIKDEDRKVNRARTLEREKRAHIEALRRVDGASYVLNEMKRELAVHALDALGLFCWGITTNLVKGAIYE
jgi:Holliday junction resolvasome RuvABC endonuclease subunit